MTLRVLHGCDDARRLHQRRVCFFSSESRSFHSNTLDYSMYGLSAGTRNAFLQKRRAHLMSRGGCKPVRGAVMSSCCTLSAHHNPFAFNQSQSKGQP